MNDDLVVPANVVIDTAMRALGHQSHGLAQVGDAEVLTVAVVAAKYFANHHERSWQVMRGVRYLSRPLSASRFNRRRHAWGGGLRRLLETRGAWFAQGEVFLLDSMPVPVCRRARARCHRTGRGPERAVLRLAGVPGLPRRRRAGGLRPAAGRAAGCPLSAAPGPRADLRLAAGGERLRRHGRQ